MQTRSPVEVLLKETLPPFLAHPQALPLSFWCSGGWTTEVASTIDWEFGNTAYVSPKTSTEGARFPTADTAFQSPTGDLLLALDDGIWHAFFPRGRDLRPEVASLRLSGTPIMAQWATGAHVTRWSDEAGSLLKAGSPKPSWIEQ